MITQTKKHQKSHSSSEAGYTILESIIAILVVTVLMVAVSPMIVFATATRIQAKRIQLATQAAKTYITTVKANPTEEAPSDDNVQPEKDVPFDAPDNADIDSICSEDVVGESGYCQGELLYCVSFDEEPGCQTNSVVDMVIQPIITEPFAPTVDDQSGNADPDLPDVSRGYGLAVRVYRASAFGGEEDLLREDQDGRTEDQAVVSLLGRSQLPLFQTQTYIPPRGGGANQFDNYCDILKGCS